MARLRFSGTARVVRMEMMSGVSQTGKDWRKAVVTLDCDPGSRWPSMAAVTLFGERSAMAAVLREGMDVRVSGTVSGREHNGRVYMDLEADAMVQAEDWRPGQPVPGVEAPSAPADPGRHTQM